MPPPGLQEGISPADGLSGEKRNPRSRLGRERGGGLIVERGCGADYFPALMAACAAARRAMGTRKGEQDT